MSLPRWAALAALAITAWMTPATFENGRFALSSAEAAQGCGVGFHR